MQLKVGEAIRCYSRNRVISGVLTVGAKMYIPLCARSLTLASVADDGDDPVLISKWLADNGEHADSALTWMFKGKQGNECLRDLFEEG